MNSKAFRYKVLYESTRLECLRLEHSNRALRSENGELRRKVEELEKMKALSGDDLKTLLEKHHQIIEVEEDRNKAVKALVSMNNIIENGSVYW